ncbi:hypothetical protein MASR2M78_21480 [Treponema sp.]
MKSIRAFLASAFVAFMLVSCAGLSVPGVSMNLPGPSLASAVGSAAGPVDFKSNEVLALYRDTDPVTGVYYVARVLTPASPATKNQAEVIFVEDGQKAWSARVLPSRKADKSDSTIGNIMMYPRGWQGHDKMDSDNYRKTSWAIGHVTNNDELFKNWLEVDGEKFAVSLLRVPTMPVE